MSGPSLSVLNLIVLGNGCMLVVLVDGSRPTYQSFCWTWLRLVAFVQRSSGSALSNMSRSQDVVMYNSVFGCNVVKYVFGLLGPSWS